MHRIDIIKAYALTLNTLHVPTYAHNTDGHTYSTYVRPAVAVTHTPAAHVPTVATWLKWPSLQGQRLKWTPGLEREGKWKVRAVIDAVAREKLADERLQAMLAAEDHSYALSLRADRAMERARLNGDVAYVAVNELAAWDANTAREVIAAREARAAERGRGRSKRGPSAARVTLRDAHSPVTDNGQGGAFSTLRNLPTVGVAPHPAATSPADMMPAIDAVLAQPKLATYRKYQWHTMPLGAAVLCDLGVWPVWPATEDDGDTDAPVTSQAAPRSHAAQRVAADLATQARMGAADPVAAQG